MADDLYSLLGVEHDATDAEIDKAFLAKAKQKHPDRGGSNEEMAALTVAHAILSDPARRADYDNGGSGAARDHTALVVDMLERWSHYVLAGERNPWRVLRQSLVDDRTQCGMALRQIHGRLLHIGKLLRHIDAGMEERRPEKLAPFRTAAASMDAAERKRAAALRKQHQEITAQIEWLDGADAYNLIPPESDVDSFRRAVTLFTQLNTGRPV